MAQGNDGGNDTGGKLSADDFRNAIALADKAMAAQKAEATAMDAMAVKGADGTPLMLADSTMNAGAVSDVEAKPQATASNAAQEATTVVAKKPADLTISDSGLEGLKKWEVERLKPYDDSTGKDIGKYVKGATIGVGHLINDSTEFETYKNGITSSQSSSLFKDDLKPFIKAVQDNVTVDLAQNQFDALVMFSFNVGVAGFKGSSALYLINNPSTKLPYNGYDSLKSAMGAFDKEVNTKGEKVVSNGLVNRRNYEYQVYSTGDYERKN